MPGMPLHNIMQIATESAYSDPSIAQRVTSSFPVVQPQVPSAPSQPSSAAMNVVATPEQQSSKPPQSSSGTAKKVPPTSCRKQRSHVPKLPSLKRRDVQAVAAATDEVVAEEGEVADRVQPDMTATESLRSDATEVPELGSTSLQDLTSRKRLREDSRKAYWRQKRARKNEEQLKAQSITVQQSVREAIAQSYLEHKKQQEKLNQAESKNSVNPPARPRDHITKNDKEVYLRNLFTSPLRGADIAQVLGKNKNTMRSVLHRMELKRFKGEDPLAEVPRGGQNPKCRKPKLLSDDQLLWAARKLTLNNCLKYRQLAEEAKAQFPALASLDGIRLAKNLHRRLHNQLGFRVSDFVAVPVARNLDRVIAARKEYCKKMSSTLAEMYESAIFIDETPFNLNLHHAKGLSQKGCRPLLPVVDMPKVPSMTIIAAVDKRSLLYHESYIGGVNGATYGEFLKNLFKKLKSLGRLSSGNRQLIIHDNCPIHKSRRFVVPVLEQWNDFLFVEQLPPYSPFLDPCEEVFAIWKHAFCDLVGGKAVNGPGGIAALVVMASERIRQEQITGAWRHARQFFRQSLEGIPVTSREILDGVHEGDEAAKAILEKYRSWGLEFHPQALSPEAQQGTGPEPQEPAFDDENPAKLPLAVPVDAKERLPNS
jgi:hypothetical protein